MELGTILQDDFVGSVRFSDVLLEAGKCLGEGSTDNLFYYLLKNLLDNRADLFKSFQLKLWQESLEDKFKNYLGDNSDYEFAEYELSEKSYVKSMSAVAPNVSLVTIQANYERNKGFLGFSIGRLTGYSINIDFDQRINLEVDRNFNTDVYDMVKIMTTFNNDGQLAMFGYNYEKPPVEGDCIIKSILINSKSAIFTERTIDKIYRDRGSYQTIRVFEIGNDNTLKLQTKTCKINARGNVEQEESTQVVYKEGSEEFMAARGTFYDKLIGAMASGMKDTSILRNRLILKSA